MRDGAGTYLPAAKTAMPIGRGQTRKWVLEYEPASAATRPADGLVERAGHLNEVRLRFDTLDEAVASPEAWLEYTADRNASREPRRRSSPTFPYDRVPG